MPHPNRPVTKQYVVLAEPVSKRASPQTPDRCSLYIQNTGDNPGLLRFAEDVRLDGGDVELAPGDHVKWTEEETTPREAINLQSDLGTTFAVIEGLLNG